MAGATDVERLAVLIEGNTKAFENAMKRVEKLTDQTSGRMERRFKDAGKRLENTFNGLGATLSRGLGLLGVGLSGRELIRFADQFTSIQNALKVTGLEGDKLNSVYGRLFESAQRNAAPLQALTTLYSRASLVQNELGVSTEDLLRFTDKVSLALRVSGQSAEQSSGALLQLSQALGSGVVRAEEFNSVLEGAPAIVQSVARGIEEAGGSVAKLRQLVVDGKVSSKAFFDAYMIGSAELEQSASKMDKTIGQAVTQLQNVLIDSVGKLDRTTGASEDVIRVLNELSAGVQWVANNIDTAAKPFREFAAVLRQIDEAAQGAARWIGQVTGAIKIGPAIKSAIGMKDELRTGITAPDLDLTGGIPGLQRSPTKPISINDPKYQAPGKEKKDNSVGVDSFERAMAQAQKRIEIQKAENATIAQGTAARERAKLVAELETAAKAANAAQGLINNEVTADQNLKIQETADKMYAVAAAAEAANEPLARAALTATDMSERFQDLAVSSIDGLSSSLADIVTGAKTAEEAFKDFAQSVVRELTQMIIKAVLFKAISTAIGFAGGGGGLLGSIFGKGTGFLHSPGGFSGAFPMPGNFARGGAVAGPGTGTSDSIPAMLSAGEYVINAAAAQRHRDLLDAINFGVPRFADGGPVQGRGMDGNAGRAYGGTQPGTRGSNVSTVRFDMRGIRKADFFTGGDLEMFADRLAGLINDGGAGRLKVELLRAT